MAINRSGREPQGAGNAPALIDARFVRWDGQHIHPEGHVDVVANRAKNVESGLPPVTIEKTIKEEPIAIVGYGPSLRETWPRIKQFKEIWTTSRAHAFLLSNGIKPTRHVDLDMRPHKAEFMENPQRGVQYMLATHVHPDYIAKMIAAGADTRLFHVAIEGGRLRKANLDSRYPQFRVRFDAGVQMAEIAHKNGFYNQHWFGIEYGTPNGHTHAGRHWGVKTPPLQVKVDGRVYDTTTMFFQGLLLGEQFLCDRPQVKIVIHGDHLLADFMQCRGRVPRAKYQK